jgi:hypothetical protein
MEISAHGSVQIKAIGIVVLMVGRCQHLTVGSERFFEQARD